MKLSNDFVREVALADSKVGRKYSDGHGFYLHVTRFSKYWRMAYRVAGKQNTLALGVYPEVSLDEARMKSKDARDLLARGVDPSLHRKATKRTQQYAVTGLRPRHPGAVLQEVVLPGLSISMESLADLLNLAVEHMEQLLNEQSPMTCHIALKLEQLLLVKAETWMTMQQSIDLWDARTELQRMQDIGRSLQMRNLLFTPNQRSGRFDAANLEQIAKATVLGKVILRLNGYSKTES